MEKLQALKTTAELASIQFTFAKSPADIRYWLKEKDRAEKEYNQYKKWLYTGSGVSGNEVTY